MVAERKKVDGLVYSQTSTPEGVPLPSYRYGRERVAHHKQRNSSEKKISDAGLYKQSVKTAWQCGQGSKNNDRL
jgi:hypothetical protein